MGRYLLISSSRPSPTIHPTQTPKNWWLVNESFTIETMNEMSSI
jgi:hypothetical protein